MSIVWRAHPNQRLFSFIKSNVQSKSKVARLNSIDQRRHFSFSDTFVNINTSIATSSAVSATKYNLIAFHEWLGVPWFVEIALVTIAARFLVTFPLMITQRRILRRYEDLKPEIVAMSNALKPKIKEQAYLHNLNEKQMQVVYTKTLTKEINRLIVRDNCHPFKASIVVFFQVPMWIILSHTYRNMARVFPDPTDPVSLNAYHQLTQEGFLWFSNLTLPDPTGILSIGTAVMNLIIIQLYVNERRRNNIQDSRLIKVITNASRAFSVVIVPIGLVMPSSLSFYWFISSSIGLLHNYLLLKPEVKQFLNLESKVKLNSSVKK